MINVHGGAYSDLHRCTVNNDGNEASDEIHSQWISVKEVHRNDVKGGDKERRSFDN